MIGNNDWTGVVGVGTRGDMTGERVLVGDSFPSSKLLAALAATADAFSFSSGLILQTAGGSGSIC